MKPRSRSVVLFCILVMCFFLMPARSMAASLGKADFYKVVDGVRVVEGQTFHARLDIQGPEWNGAIIRNNVFQGQHDSALHVGDVQDLVIENNEFSDMDGFPVKLKTEQDSGTRNVVIRGNRFRNLPNTAVLVGVPNKNVTIIDNIFQNVALDTVGDKKHAMYVKGPDFLIEGNIIIGVGDAHGISVRTSGVVRGNYVENAEEDGIKYFSSSTEKGSGTLVIEGNVLVNNKHGGIGFDTGDGVKVDRIDVRFNTVVNNTRAIRINEGLDSVDFYIYGNLFVEKDEKFYSMKKDPVLMMDNVALQDTTVFVDAAGRNYRLRSPSPAVNAVGGVPGLPPYDFSKVNMGPEPYAAGAFQQH